MTSAPKNRKRVALIFSSVLWREGAGLWARSAALCRALSEVVDLYLVHLGARPAPIPTLRARTGAVEVLELAGIQPRQPELRYRLVEFLSAHGVDSVIIERAELAPIVRLLPRHLRTLIDTHDIAHERRARMQGFGFDQPGPSEAEERALIDAFDLAIAIQHEDAVTLVDWLGKERVVLAPHPPPLEALERRQQVRTIGLVASRWVANVDGIRWFLEHIWPLADLRGICVKIFGSVCQELAPHPDLILSGFVPDLRSIYEELDIVINPVRFGAGLKVKSVEALGYGRPLLTTSEGARGLARPPEPTFVVADEPERFAAQLRSLVNDRSRRETLARTAFTYASQHLTPRHCFGGLCEYLLSDRHARSR